MSGPAKTGDPDDTTGWVVGWRLGMLFAATAVLNVLTVLSMSHTRLGEYIRFSWRVRNLLLTLTGPFMWAWMVSPVVWSVIGVGWLACMANGVASPRKALARRVAYVAAAVWPIWGLGCWLAAIS